MPETKLYYRLSELPELFAVSLNTVKAWLKNGTLNLIPVEIPSTTSKAKQSIFIYPKDDIAREYARLNATRDLSGKGK